jgi:hypothetical protein
MLLWLATSVKLLCEVALMALAARFVLGAWIGLSRERNPFHRLLGWIVGPVEQVAGRWVVPVLAVLWLAATVGKIRLCLDLGATACR